jgi:hypothetical protein
MQQFLKQPPRTTWAQVVAAELFAQVDIAMHDAVAAFDFGFRREAPAALR